MKDEHDSTEAAEGDDMFVVSLPLPKGWHSDLDTLTGQTCYVNTAGGARVSALLHKNCYNNTQLSVGITVFLLSAVSRWYP